MQQIEGALLAILVAFFSRLLQLLFLDPDSRHGFGGAVLAGVDRKGDGGGSVSMLDLSGCARIG